ncbi:hypothetical protein SDC9_191470 [bioreactor metagenome]|uniref:Uncharacterized protein n=1 Tax=bioreactor metagenome TaxID=1076179 RepID=A0A645I0E3_9ZZZZ
MARLNHRRVVTGKLHVAVVIGTFHLPGVETKLAHGARIAARAQPVLHRVINVALIAVQTRRSTADLFDLLGKIAGVDRCADGIRLVHQ